MIVNPDETDVALELVDGETYVHTERDLGREFDLAGFDVIYADAAPSFAEYKHLIYLRVVDLRAAPDDIVVSVRGQAYPWEERNP